MVRIIKRGDGLQEAWSVKKYVGWSVEISLMQGKVFLVKNISSTLQQKIASANV